MGLDKLGWSQRKPVAEADVLKDVSLEDLEELQRRVARVLDVVS